MSELLLSPVLLARLEEAAPPSEKEAVLLQLLLSADTLCRMQEARFMGGPIASLGERLESLASPEGGEGQ